MQCLQDLYVKALRLYFRIFNICALSWLYLTVSRWFSVWLKAAWTSCLTSKGTYYFFLTLRNAPSSAHDLWQSLKLLELLKKKSKYFKMGTKLKDRVPSFTTEAFRGIQNLCVCFSCQKKFLLGNCLISSLKMWVWELKAW